MINLIDYSALVDMCMSRQMFVAHSCNVVYVLFVYNSNVYYFDLIQTELTTRIVQQMAAINHPHAF